jgi:hypothetical protein
LLDFTDMDGEKKDESFAAVRAGANRDYEAMKKIKQMAPGRKLIECRHSK